MKKLILIIALTLSISTLAQAQTVNKTCPEVVPKHFRAVYQENFGLLAHYSISPDIYGENTPTLNQTTCNEFKKLATVIHKLKQKFGKYLLYPKDVVVNMVEKDSNAFNFQGYLNLPKSLFVSKYKFDQNGDVVDIKNLYKHPKHNVPVWAHEYGHSIFGQMMSVSSNNWKSLQNILSTYKNKMVAFTDKHNPLLRKCKNKYDVLKKRGMDIKVIREQLQAECVIPLNKLRLISNQAADNLEAKIEPLMPIMQAAKPYNEFFADVITVTFLNNGAAVHDALYRSGMNYHKSSQKSRGRDFTTHKNDLDVMERSPAHFIQPGEHNLFSAARAHVWKYYLSNPIYKEKMGLTIQEIFKAIVGEVKKLESAIRNKPFIAEMILPSQNYVYSPEQRQAIKDIIVTMNRNLIKVIDQQLKNI